VRLRVALPILFLLIVAAFLAFAPASLADARLAAATDGRVRLADATGTVWRGAGVLTDAHGTWRLPLAWRASPLAALRGVADVDLAPQGRLVANGGVAVNDLRVSLPAAALAGVLPSVPAVDTGGDLLLDAPAFRFDGRGGDGALSLRWDRARAVVNGSLLDLGDVTARVTPRENGLAGTLTGDGGALRVAGDFAWSNGQASVNATLTPVGSLPPEIARVLSAIGPADANGAVRASWRGTLR
jgi:general secretion pathway protein N